MFLLTYFILALNWYRLGNTTWKETRGGWRLVLFMLFMMIVINTIITGGGAGGVVPPGGQLVGNGFTLFGKTIHFGLTVERLWFAICQILRVLGISMNFILIPYTMDARSYGATFSSLGMPDKLAYTTELAIRFIPSLARNFSVTMGRSTGEGI